MEHICQVSNSIPVVSRSTHLVTAPIPHWRLNDYFHISKMGYIKTDKNIKGLPFVLIYLNFGLFSFLSEKPYLSQKHLQKGSPEMRT